MILEYLLLALCSRQRFVMLKCSLDEMLLLLLAGDSLRIAAARRLVAHSAVEEHKP